MKTIGLNDYTPPNSNIYSKFNNSQGDLSRKLMTGSQQQVRTGENIGTTVSPYCLPVRGGGSEKSQGQLACNFKQINPSVESKKSNNPFFQENEEAKHTFTPKQIENKYGLGVRILEKTPRSSYANQERKNSQMFKTIPEQNREGIVCTVPEQSDPRSFGTPMRVQKVIDNIDRKPQAMAPSEPQQIAPSPIVKRVINNNLNANKPFQNPVQNFAGVLPQYASTNPSNRLTDDTLKEKITAPMREIGSLSDLSRNHQYQTENPQSQRPLGTKNNIQIEMQGTGKFLGNLKNNCMTGFGSLFDSKNRLIFEGDFCNNHFEGIGIMYNYQQIDNDEESRLLSQGHICSSWIKSEGLFQNSLRSGSHTLTYQNGTSFSGQFENDNANGFGVLTFPNNKTIAGVWEKNVLISHMN